MVSGRKGNRVASSGRSHSDLERVREAGEGTTDRGVVRRGSSFGRRSVSSLDDTETLDLSILRRVEKAQSLGRQIISTLYMLVRNVKIHSPDNAIFLKPIDTLRELMNRIIASEGRLQLQAIDTSVYINDVRIRFDFNALESVKYLTGEFERQELGGFTALRTITSQEIRELLAVFSGQPVPKPEEAPEGGIPALKWARFAEVKKILDKLEAEPDLDQQIDRKKYLMTVYARCVFFMQKYFERLLEGKEPLPFARAARLVQDLVDLCYGVRTHFLGATTIRMDTHYLAYHSVNVTMLSIVFGQELGLDKRQLHELGMAALFCGMGLIEVPTPVMESSEPLSDEHRALIDRYPLRTVRRILAGRGLDKVSMRRIVSVYESRIDCALPRVTAEGDTELVVPQLQLGVFGRIIAICDVYDALTSKRPFRDAYGPEIALALMAHELRYRFDPSLLRVFMKVMAIQPLKIMSDRPRTLRMV